MIGSEALTDLGVLDAVDAIRRAETTSSELVEACLRRIMATDPAIEAWAFVDADAALEAARTRDADVRADRSLGPLHGVPIGVKDIIDVAGMPTTAGAAAFAHTHPDRDATLVARLRSAGAVMVGKTVATQFAFRDPAPTRNPWSYHHTPGGSSSGSAAAVAARQVPAAIGTQTVGSILRPSAFCGVVGLKGAHGRVPLEGVVPLAPSLDHAGPIARSVADAAIIEAVLSGDPFEIPTIDRPLLGISRDLLGQAEPDHIAHLDRVVGRLAGAGATIVDLELPAGLDDFVAAGWRLLEAQAAAYHRDAFAQHRADYGPRIAELVTAGLALRPADVIEARRVRHAYRAALIPVLDSVDVLLAPVAPGPAPRRDAGTGDPGLCAPWSFAGMPAMSLPTGTDDTGLPLALQLIAGPANLTRLLGAAARCDAVVGFAARPPERAIQPGGSDTTLGA